MNQKRKLVEKTKPSKLTDLGYLQKLDEELQAIKSEIERIKSTLKNKADQKRLADIEAKVEKLEKELFYYRNVVEAGK